MSVLVYVPGAMQKPRTVDLLRSVGLELLFDEGAGIDFADVLAGGPDGGSGLLVKVAPDGEPLHYSADKQEWHKLTPSPDGKYAAGRAWIGWDREQRPGPAQLARRQQLSGEWMTLRDGNAWLVPIIRQLPKFMGLDDDGSVSGLLEPAYQEFYDDSLRVFSEFVEKNGKITIDWERAFSYSVRALAMNYRVSRDVVARLGLLTDRLMWELVQAVIEAQRYAEMILKKNDDEPASPSSSDSAAPSSSSTSGDADSCPAIDPRSSTNTG